MAFVVVEFTAVKFWSVVEAVASKVPTVIVPKLTVVANRFVEEAVVAKDVVVVAFVVVELSPVKFCNVLDAFTRRVFVTKTLAVAFVEYKLVELAVVAKDVVVVAFVVVELSPVKFCNVEDPVTRKFPKVPSPETIRERRLELPKTAFAA